MKILKILFVFIFCLILMSCGKEYTVTFDTDGGTIIESVKVKKGEKIAKPSDPIKEGYKFNGWYFNDEEWSFIGYIVTDDMELKAKWESNEYKVIFDTDGGNIIEDITLKIGDKIIKPNDPVKEGHTFDGWYYNDEAWNFEENLVTENITLTSKWIVNEYTITINNEDVSIINTITLKYGDDINIEVPSMFSALGYDTVYIAKQAIEQAGSADYDKVINALTYGTYKGLVTSNEEFSYEDGNPQKELFVITFKDGKEVEAK